MDISNVQKSDQAGESSHPKHNAIEPEHGNVEKPVNNTLAGKSSVGTTRVLRSRSQEKLTVAEPSINTAKISSRRKQNKAKKKKGGESSDEFSKARKRLGYLLHRISYEQNLIDVYSGEGWKGQSLEKIKPDKELQRARDEIFRCKLKIRDFFRHVDTLCSEGRLPDSLFDADGEIDSEDIFCAKCQSDNLTTNNDIILCDGVCERGFHQLCLQPPLITVPLGDDGWLCPGCDCKVDCFDLLNESQGTDLSIEDNWEKVFPEAALAAAAANDKIHSFGLSSDDSDDNDYNPDGPDVDDEMVQGDDSGSSETEYISASSELEVSPNDDQFLGLPSDDSEDDDFDPDVLHLREQNKMENSSSDFTSDSEDLDATIKEAEQLENLSDDGSKHSSHSDDQKSEYVGSRCPGKDDLSSMLELDPGQDSAPLSGKRLVERLDYKKLYEETYGGTSSDSSDDGDWNDSKVPCEGSRSSEEVLLSSPNNCPINKNGKNKNKGKFHLKNSDHCSSGRRTRQKLNIEVANDSTALFHEVSTGSGSSRTRVRRQPNKRFGETVTQGLNKYFEENQYPDRTRKQELGEELGITAQQVSKWFENARWSFNHSSSMGTGKNALKLTPTPTNEKPPETEANVKITEYFENDREDNNFSTEESCTRRRSKSSFQSQASDHTSGPNVEAAKSLACSPDAQVLCSSSTKKKKRGRSSV